MERQVASSAGAHPGGIKIASDDGVVTFQLKRCVEGVVMERTRNRLGRGRVFQAMQFREEASLIQWCEGDPLRFAYPLLFANLRRSGCALFHSPA